MAQQTDFAPQHPASLFVFVHRRTLADPWECTCVVSADTPTSLSCAPILFRSANSPEAQVFVKFWLGLATRCELVLNGLD